MKKISMYYKMFKVERICHTSPSHQKIWLKPEMWHVWEHFLQLAFNSHILAKFPLHLLNNQIIQPFVWAVFRKCWNKVGTRFLWQLVTALYWWKLSQISDHCLLQIKFRTLGWVLEMNKSNFALDTATSRAFLTNIILRNNKTKYNCNKMTKYSYFSPTWAKTSDW